MKKLLRSFKFWLSLALITAAFVALFAHYRANRFKVLDKAAFADTRDRFAAAAESGAFETQEQLSSYIKNWADEVGLKYKNDSAGNIIINRKAVDRKKDDPATVIILGMNYRTTASETDLYATAASIASTDLESGRVIVIFANDEDEVGSGFKTLKKKYIPDNSNVFYLDYGDKAYVSVNSFGKAHSEIIVPAKTEDAELDTAIRIHIDGINSKEVTADIESQPGPLYALSAILSRLKSKSTDYRIADIQVGSNGDMYPSSLDATIMINSYSLPSITKYIDQHINNWDKAQKKNHPDFSYTYEIIEDEEAIPKSCYDAETSDLITKLLYTVNTGAYKFSESDAIPEGKKVEDLSGVNCILNLEKRNNDIVLTLMSEGCNEMYLNRILVDNKAAAELLDCKCNTLSSYDAFVNDNNALLESFRSIYTKVNSGADRKELILKDDEFFTPCSYLLKKNSDADIIHLRLSSKSAVRLTNTIMCYIKTNGNIFTL